MKQAGIFFILSLFLFLPSGSGAEEPGDCLACHEDIDQKVYLQSVHGKGTCTNCHLGVTPDHPEDEPGKVDCGICHSEAAADYQASIHGEIAGEDPESAPTCIGCHGAHDVDGSDSKEFRRSALDNCGKCHEDSLRTYLDTYHGKVTDLGYLNAMPLCWDCHKSHRVLPASDPESPVSEAKVLVTCLYCHPDANDNFARYRVHGDKFSPKKDPISFWTYLVMFCIVCFAFGTWVPHTILWFIRDQLEAWKAKKSRPSPPPSEPGGGS